MYHTIRKIFLALFCTFAVGNVFAEVGYIKHTIINNTPNEYYIGLRQQFFYPIEGCQGVVAPHETKVCEGPYDVAKYATFIMTAIFADTSENNLQRGVSNYNLNQSLAMTWTLNLDGKGALKVLLAVTDL